MIPGRAVAVTPAGAEDLTWPCRHPEGFAALSPGGAAVVSPVAKAASSGGAVAVRPSAAGSVCPSGSGEDVRTVVMARRNACFAATGPTAEQRP